MEAKQSVPRDLLQKLARRVVDDEDCPFYVLTDLREIALEMDKAEDSTPELPDLIATALDNLAWVRNGLREKLDADDVKTLRNIVVRTEELLREAEKRTA